MDYWFKKAQDTLHEIESGLSNGSNGVNGQNHSSNSSNDLQHQHQYGSFAPQRDGNDVKWFVDGCSYMWAVSRAIEQAGESIWILDCEYLSVP